MEKKEFVKLYHEDIEDIEFHPDWSRMECFLAMAERARLICEESKKNHEVKKKKISDSERVERQGKSKNQIKDKDIEIIESPSDDWPALYYLAAAVEGVSVLEERKKVKEMNSERDKQQPDAKNHQLNTAKNMGKTKKRHASDHDIDNNNNNENEYQDKPKKKKKVKMGRNIIEQQQQKNSEISSMMLQTLPAEYMNALETLADGKSIKDVNLVLQKKIYQTDISKKHNRLSLPKHVYRCSFLREKEVSYLKSVKENNENSMNSIEVDVIEPSLETSKLDLREWAISKGMYVLTKGWNKLVARNSIEVNQILEIWTARVDQKLCFLLVRIPANNN